jgi:hypothetical protein
MLEGWEAMALKGPAESSPVESCLQQVRKVEFHWASKAESYGPQRGQLEAESRSTLRLTTG